MPPNIIYAIELEYRLRVRRVHVYGTKVVQVVHITRLLPALMNTGISVTKVLGLHQGDTVSVFTLLNTATSSVTRTSAIGHGMDVTD